MKKESFEQAVNLYSQAEFFNNFEKNCSNGSPERTVETVIRSQLSGNSIRTPDGSYYHLFNSSYNNNILTEEQLEQITSTIVMFVEKNKQKSIKSFEKFKPE